MTNFRIKFLIYILIVFAGVLLAFGQLYPLQLLRYGDSNTAWLDPVSKSVFYGTRKGLVRIDKTGIFDRVTLTLIDENVRAIFGAQNSGLYFLGTDTGVFRTTDGGNTWLKTTDPLGSLKIFVLTGDPHDTRLLYAITNRGIIKSVDQGNTWSLLTKPPDSPAEITSLAISPASSQVLYAGTTERGIFKSQNGGLNWEQINRGFPPSSYKGGTLAWVNIILIHPNYPQNIYVGLEGAGIYTSSDDGVTWTSRNGGPYMRSFSVTALTLDPAHPDQIFAGITFRRDSHRVDYLIYRTIDGGTNWTELAQLPAPAQFLSFDPANRLVAVTRDGLQIFDLSQSSRQQIEGPLKQ